MTTAEFCEYRVVLSRDEETAQVVAEVPTLGISDYGLDSEEALDRMREMLSFHLESLEAEGKDIPSESPGEEGLYLRVRRPAHAA